MGRETQKQGDETEGWAACLVTERGRETNIDGYTNSRRGRKCREKGERRISAFQGVKETGRKGRPGGRYTKRRTGGDWAN